MLTQPDIPAKSPKPPVVAASVPEAKPVEVVDFEQAVKPKASGQSKDEDEASYFFAEIGVLQMPGERTIHVKNHHMSFTDPEIIAHLDNLAKDRLNRIFRQ